MPLIFSLVVTIGLTFATTTLVQTPDQQTNQISTADGPRYVVVDK